jgi:transposase
VDFRKKQDSNAESILLPKNQIKFENGDLRITTLSPVKEDSILKLRSRTLKKYSNLEICHSVRLLKKGNHYYIFIPESTNIIYNEYPTELEEYCGVDGGVRDYMTVFSNKNIVEYNRISS